MLKAVWAVLSGSIALGGDAVHSLTDVFAYGSAYVAARAARRGPTAAFTYGYGRGGVLAALANAVLLVVLAVLVGAGAIGAALSGHDHPAPLAMVAGGAAGLGVSLAIGLVLRPGDGQTVNRRAAFVHAAADAASSAGVVAAGVLIWLTGIMALDAAAAAVIAAVIVMASWGVIRETAATLMEAVPAGVRVDDVVAAVAAVEGVRGLHHVHVWRLDEGIAMSGHLVLDADASPSDAQACIDACARRLAERFGIGHATLQPELGPDPG